MYRLAFKMVLKGLKTLFNAPYYILLMAHGIRCSTVNHSCFIWQQTHLWGGVCPCHPCPHHQQWMEWFSYPTQSCRF